MAEQFKCKERNDRSVGALNLAVVPACFVGAIVNILELTCHTLTDGPERSDSQLYPDITTTIAAALVCSVQGDWETLDESHVLVLNSENFDTTIDTNKIILVEFYAPWCGHCQQLAPEYAKAASQLAETHEDIILAKVDATEEAELASKYDVTGYPTLKIFRDGNNYDYEGGRSADDIVRVMEEHADPNWKPPADQVITLTEDNFDEVVNSADLILVEFYAPWCGHCKRLAPEYEKAARDLWNSSPRIPLAKVDATAETNLAQRFEISSYPTLNIFRKGKKYEYTGGRDRSAIVKEMLELASPPAKFLETVFDIDQAVDGEDPVVVGFFENENSPALDIYQDAASSRRKLYNYAYATSDAIREAYGVVGEKVAIFQPKRLHSKLEKPSVSRPVGKDAQELAAWIETHGYPIVGHRSNRGVDIRKYETTRPLVVVYFDADFSKDLRDETNFWREKITQTVLDRYGDKVNKDLYFVIASEGEYDNELADFKRKGSDEEFTVAIFAEENAKYLMEDEFDIDNFQDFVDAFLEGKLKPYLKSEPVPRKTKGPVVQVVADNFDKIVNDKSKDVLIEFYAPWCGHCKALEPKYKKLAKKLSKVDDLVIAKMDATANDVPPPYKVTGFPTIFFAPRDKKKEPVQYSGDREVKDFLKFLKEHSMAKIPLSKGKSKAGTAKEEL
eukprot:gene1726-4846_t